MKEKRMSNYVDETSVKPIGKKDEAKYVKELETWDVGNSKILTWINNYVSQSIGVQLAKYDTSKEVCDHFKRLYAQFRYQLESYIRALKQNNMTIHEFYYAMTTLWDQLALMELTELKGVKVYTDQEKSNDQFNC